MTLELSLRQRAKRSRIFASLWLVIAAGILIGAFIYAPFAATSLLSRMAAIELKTSAVNGTIDYVVKSDTKSQPALMDRLDHPEIFALAVIAFSLFAACFASYLTARAALHELHLSSRWSCLADAACVAGSDFSQYERAITMMVPKSGSFFGSEVFSTSDLKLFTDLLKSARG